MTRYRPLHESSRPDPVTVWSDRIGLAVFAVVALALGLACVAAVVR